MKLIETIQSRFHQHYFLFEELVKRDFKKRYKRTSLGILWSLLGPMLQLLVMYMVMVHFFGRDIPHFMIHVFSGMLVFSFFRESTGQGMQSLMANSGILTKMRVPKYIFLLSKNVSTLVSFSMSLVIFFIFVAVEGIAFHPRFILLIYPIISLMIFNIGIGLVLSALFVFFRDIQYLYDIFTMLLMWMSAIFYNITIFSENTQRLFLLNPVFAHIHYVRLIVLQGLVPAWHIHLICAGYSIGALAVGAFFYKRYRYRFVYYM